MKLVAKDRGITKRDVYAEIGEEMSKKYYITTNLLPKCKTTLEMPTLQLLQIH